MTLKADLTVFGDNTEFTNPFRDGETLLGSSVRLSLDLALNDKVTIRGGAFGNQRFGSRSAFDLVRPVFSLILQTRRSRLVFGTLETVERREGIGPDRTGPHSLLPPLQRETLAFTRPYEAGVQWTTRGARGRHEVWLNWQQVNSPAQREQLDAGAAATLVVKRPVALGFQWHIVHRGGQLYSAGPVSDSQALGPGVIAEWRGGWLDEASVELYGLVSRHVPDRGRLATARTGVGGFARASAERAGWRGHLLFWRACDFIKEEGDPNYSSLRRDGSRYRRTRDYAEAGVTRLYQPAPQVAIEASARVHRVEGDYEYSYRILAIAHLGWRLR